MKTLAFLTYEDLREEESEEENYDSDEEFPDDEGLHSSDFFNALRDPEMYFKILNLATKHHSMTVYFKNIGFKVMVHLYPVNDRANAEHEQDKMKRMIKEILPKWTNVHILHDWFHCPPVDNSPVPEMEFFKKMVYDFKPLST